MNKVLAVLAGGVLIGAFAVAYAELPPPSAQEKAAAAAKAGKAAAEKAKEATELARAQDKAVANWRKNKGLSSSAGTTTQPAPREGSAAAPAPSAPQGADHSKAKQPDSELTRREAQTQMPIPGQANDHSTTARDPRNSSGRQ
jgi:hypothetical protein